MTLGQRLRRAAGKPPGYIVRRAAQEAGRRLGARQLRRRLERLDADTIARAAGHATLRALWHTRLTDGFLYETAALDALPAGLADADRSSLARRFESVLAHRFDLLGSGPTDLGPAIDWHRDFKSGRRWPLDPSHGIDYAELGRPSDVKVPWELSRCQHLVTLGQAWVVWRDPRAVAEVEAQLLSWIAANPPGRGVNWACTMEVALRAVNWIWTLALMADAPIRAHVLDATLVSLFAHGLWIPRHLEHGAVNGNHFFSDALGLVACGAVFRDHPDGVSWLGEGVRLMEREIRQQVSDDGVDIEASVPYHRLVLELCLVGWRLMSASGRTPSDEYRHRVARMVDFVRGYTMPDGLSPVIGDADDGRVLMFGNQDLRDHRYLVSMGDLLAGRAGDVEADPGSVEEVRWFMGREVRASAPRATDASAADRAWLAWPDAGFFVARTKAQYLFVDAGPVGFRGLGGHGHNDCLSFEWHAGDQALLTDSGAFVYTSDYVQRNLFRSTAFHNTLRIDGQEINRLPSEFALWSLADDARPIDVRWSDEAGVLVLEAGHTGYHRLPDPVTVRRRFDVARTEPAMTITDRLEGRGTHDVEIFFHVAPGADLGRVSAREIAATWPTGWEMHIHQSAGPELDWDRQAGAFSPSYGRQVPRGVWRAYGRLTLPARIQFRLTARGPATFERA